MGGRYVVVALAIRQFNHDVCVEGGVNFLDADYLAFLISYRSVLQILVRSRFLDDAAFVNCVIIIAAGGVGCEVSIAFITQA